MSSVDTVEMTVKEFLEKALTSSDLGALAFQGAGRLQPEQARRFIQMTVEETKLLGMVRREEVTRNAGELHKISMDQPSTYSAIDVHGGEAIAPTQYEAGPTFSRITYQTKKAISWMDISEEIGEENITGSWAAFKQVLFEAWSRRVANDHELMAIQGDENAGTADATARCRSVNDGWLKQIIGSPNSHLYDWSGAPVSDELFSRAIRLLPTKYMGRLNEFRFFGPFELEQDLRDYWASRGTALGDRYVNTNEPVRPRGIEYVSIPLWDTTHNYTTGDLTPVTAQPHYLLLCHPQNLVYVISREIETFLERKPRRDAWEATLYSKTDFIVENFDSCVLIYNIGSS